MSYAENAKRLREDIVLVRSVIADDQAVKVKHLYDQWETLIGTTAVPGLRFLYGEDLYKVTGIEHTFSREWMPGIDTAALYTRIDESHAGTIDDPIPYEGNMVLEQGKYYAQGGVTYRCIRDTGIAVYNPLADLVGIYVEVAT